MRWRGFEGYESVLCSNEVLGKRKECTVDRAMTPLLYIFIVLPLAAFFVFVIWAQRRFNAAKQRWEARTQQKESTVQPQVQLRAPLPQVKDQKKPETAQQDAVAAGGSLKQDSKDPQPCSKSSSACSSGSPVPPPPPCSAATTPSIAGAQQAELIKNATERNDVQAIATPSPPSTAGPTPTQVAPHSPGFGARSRPFLGFALKETDNRVIVDRITTGGPAHAVGIGLDDVIEAIGTTRVASLSDVQQAVKQHCVVGEYVAVQFRRGEVVDTQNVWVMTVDAACKGQDCFFNLAHLEPAVGSPPRSPSQPSSQHAAADTELVVDELM